ncbi:MAG TPA: hypothetical protein VFR95_02840 [Gemmatimonadaceae bacterium]|nr:hypothetical protein [Gemmatimonadaceae bacterium]
MAGGKAVVTDLVMPEMGGGELSERIVARRPGIKVLLMSGYARDEVVRRNLHARDRRSSRSPSPRRRW